MAKGNELVIQARDRKAGMDMEEVTNALASARTHGYTFMGRTEVGFNGQIQSMTFRDKGTKK